MHSSHSRSAVDRHGSSESFYLRRYSRLELSGCTCEDIACSAFGNEQEGTHSEFRRSLPEIKDLLDIMARVFFADNYRDYMGTVREARK